MKKLLPLIENRFSPLAFNSNTIEEDILFTLFIAASKAPSSYNEQPWRFYYSNKGSESYKKLIESMTKYNQVWASTAPVLVIVACKKYFSHNNKLNPHANFDTGTAIGLLLIQAMEFNIYGHMMGGFDVEKIRENFSINSDFDIITILALGYLGDPEMLPSEYYDRATKRTTRKQITEFVFKI